jgi:hypothetical protein
MERSTVKSPLMLVPAALLAACGGGERNRAAACGIAQLAGPAIVQQQLDVTRQILTAAPVGLPPELPARVVGQRETSAAVSYVGEQVAVSYTGAGFPLDPQVGFGLLVVDDTSQRVVGVLIYDAVAPKGRPELGYVTGGERSVPLFGVRVSWVDVSNPRCPLLGDTAQSTTP